MSKNCISPRAWWPHVAVGTDDGWMTYAVNILMK